jgi:hypothetical protein
MVVSHARDSGLYPVGMVAAMADRVDRPARVDDMHRIAASLPHVTRLEGPKGNSIYQVGGKSFVFFRTPQPDAADAVTGERYADVIMLWVESESDKLASPQTTSTGTLRCWCGRVDWRKSAGPS